MMAYARSIPPVPRLRLRQAESGFSTLEALIAGAMVVTAAAGVAVAFGAQQNAAVRAMQDEMARDVSASVDADAAALAAYSVSAHDAIANTGPTSVTVTTPSGPAQVTIAGTPGQAVLGVRVIAGAARGEEVLPLPNPRPAP